MTSSAVEKVVSLAERRERHDDKRNVLATKTAGEPFVSTPFSQIQEREVEMLWNPYIPIGELTLAEGDPEAGKGWFSYALAAWVSKGQYPLGNGRQGRVLISSAEDAEDAVIKKRLRIVGAKMDDVEFLPPRPNLLGDMERFCAFVRQKGFVLVILDPLTSVLPKNVDPNKAEQVKPVLDELVGYAREGNFAVYIIRHYAKGQTTNAIYKGAGSVQIIGTARSTLAFGHDPEFEAIIDPFQRRIIVTHAKINVAPSGPSLKFELRNDSFEYLGTADLSAYDLLQQEQSNGVLRGGLLGEDKSKIQEAEDYLREKLAAGSVERREIMTEGQKVLNLSERTLERAGERLKVKKERTYNKQGKITGSTWQLPETKVDKATRQVAGGLADGRMDG